MSGKVLQSYTVTSLLDGTIDEILTRCNAIKFALASVPHYTRLQLCDDRPDAYFNWKLVFYAEDTIPMLEGDIEKGML